MLPLFRRTRLPILDLVCFLKLGVHNKQWKLNLEYICNLFNVFSWQICVIHMSMLCTKKLKFNKIPNEQPAFRCQPAFWSHSQSLTNKLFSSFFFVSLSYASRAHDEKRTFFIIFKCFLSFWTMVKIHNSCYPSTGHQNGWKVNKVNHSC